LDSYNVADVIVTDLTMGVIADMTGYMIVTSVATIAITIALVTATIADIAGFIAS
jgi:hypothetical protein